MRMTRVNESALLLAWRAGAAKMTALPMLHVVTAPVCPGGVGLAAALHLPQDGEPKFD